MHRRVLPENGKHALVVSQLLVVTLWGFRPGLWRSEQGANLVRDDGSERPALQWLRRYLHGKTE